MKMDHTFDADIAKPKSIAIIHPDLGIGGAERLIVDVAVGLQDLGHDITVYTSHYDKHHCFEETTNLKIEVYGDFLPRHILGRFTIVCATIRQIYLTFKLLWLTKSSYDFYIIDSLAACLPLIWLYNVIFKSYKNFSKVIFYCHFPDLMLVRNLSTLSKLYRVPFDYYEQFCYMFPNVMYVNSNFTKSIFHQNFPSLAAPSVVYPCIDETVKNNPTLDLLVESNFAQSKFFLSVNRFERKKNIDLAIRAYKQSGSNFKLVIAGGYDLLVSENVKYLQELTDLATELGLKSLVYHKYPEIPAATDAKVIFLPNISSDLRNSLLKYALLLLYTPSFEHFGIVPLEAMQYNTLVLAVDNGGPKETITPYENGKGTGFLKPADASVWAEVLVEAQEIQLKTSDGTDLIHKLFTRKVLSDRINEDIVECSKFKTNLNFKELQRIVYFAAVVTFAPIIGLILMQYL